jgi:HEAT repeat protein
LKNGNTLLSDLSLLVTENRLIEVGDGGRLVREYYLRGSFGSLSSARECFEMLRLGFDGPPKENLDHSLTLRVKGLTSGDPHIRSRSARLVGASELAGKREIEALIQTLADPDSQVRQAAAEGLGQVNAKHLPLLLQSAKDPRAQVRYGIIKSASTFRETHRDMLLPMYLAAWKDEDRQIRHEALRNLGTLGPDRVGVLKVLGEALRDDEISEDKAGTSLAATAAWYLESYEGRARPLLSDLIRTFQSKDPEARLFAVKSMRHFRSDSQLIIPALIKTLEDVAKLASDPNTELLKHVALSLGEFGPEARDALGQLEVLAKNPNAVVRSAATDAIRRIKR